MFSDLTVLYLEDEPLIALEGEDLLKEFGFRDVVSVSSIHAAERSLAENRFDLAVLDIHLGGNATSLGLARSMSEQDVPVIFVTGYDRRELPDDLVDVPLVEKPTSAEKLRQVLVKTLAG